MTRLNNQVIDWQNIDEIIEGFAQWDETAGIMEAPKPKKDKKQLVLKSARGASDKSFDGRPKKEIRKNQRKKSPYKVLKAEDTSERVLPRKKSEEDMQFDIAQARSSSMRRQKRLKRKHSAETMQKFFRKKQAQKRMAERRALKNRPKRL